ncbi:MAG TPA: hypothetical protein DCP53_07865 [Elusimicrobia bacterium]|nr:hypothetical protein [Elusimicrobiota bacterium]
MLNFKSKIVVKSLNYFLLNEDKKVYINELARKISEEPKNVYRILLKLEELGVLASEYIGRERYFFVDKEKSIYKGYKTIFMSLAGIENLLIKTLNQINDIKEVYIYGSYANNKLKADSDIDLLLIGKYDILKVQKKLREIQQIIGREINTVDMSPEEFIKKKKNKDQLIKTIFENKTIRLI